MVTDLDFFLQQGLFPKGSSPNDSISFGVSVKRPASQKTMQGVMLSLLLSNHFVCQFYDGSMKIDINDVLLTNINA